MSKSEVTSGRPPFRKSALSLSSFIFIFIDQQWQRQQHLSLQHINIIAAPAAAWQQQPWV